jgi:hypothetical protein
MTARNLTISKEKFDHEDLVDEGPTFVYYRQSGLNVLVLEVMLSVMTGGLFYLMM